MKSQIKNSLILILSFTTLSSYGQSRSSQIHAATVYLNGAQVERQAELSLKKGKHLLKFNGITTDIDPNSIQVKSNMDLTLMSIKHERSYIENQKLPLRIKTIKDSLNTLRVQLLNEENGRFSLEEELSFIISNKNIKGNETLTIEDLNEVADLYRTRIPIIKSQLLIKQLLIEQLKEKMAKYQKELQTTNAIQQQSESIIFIEVIANSPTQGMIEFSYYTPQAYWIPYYDIRAKDIGDPIQLTYKADVRQTTGNDWEQIQLTLSTANPSIGGDAPVLDTWVLQYYYGSKNSNQFKKGQKYELDLEVSYGVASDIGKEKISSNNSEVIMNATNIHFNIPIKYDIQSNFKPTSVEINAHEITADYSYYAVPKKNTSAFLRARMTNWSSYNLLPGKTSLFFEGSYVGDSYIDPFITNDTLNVSLGTDKGIIIERIKNDSECKKSIFGLGKKEQIAWDINVRNTKNKAIELILEDQIPLSKNKEVTVSLLSETSILGSNTPVSNGAEYDEKTGKLTWRITLAPGEKFKASFAYEVRLPKNKTVILE